MTTVTQATTKIGSEEVVSLVLRRRPLQKMFYTALHHLSKIAVEHESWNDRLSLNMYRWAAAILKSFKEEAEFSPLRQQEATQRVQELSTHILVSSLDGAPLQNPVIDQDGLTWEKDKYEDFCKLSKLHMAVRPHLYVEVMTAWVKSLPFLASGAIAKAESQTLTSAPVADDETRRHSYYFLVRKAKELASLEQAAEQVDEMKRSFSIMTQQLLKQASEQKKSTETQFDHLQKTFNARLNFVETAHIATIGVLKSNSEAQAQEIKAANAQVSATERKCSQQQEEMRQLRINFQNKCVEVEHLRAAANDDDGCCIM